MDAEESRKPKSRRTLSPHGWAIWGESSPTVIIVLAVDVLAALLVSVAVLVTAVPTVVAPGWGWLALGVWPSAPGGSPLIIASLLVAASALHLEIAQRVDRARLVVKPDRVVNVTTVWTFAAVLSVPPAWAATVAVGIYAYSWLRSWRSRARLYRTVLSAASVVVAAISAVGAVAALDGLTGSSDISGDGVVGASSVGMLVDAVVAMVVYAVVQQVVVLTVVKVATGGRGGAATQVSGEEYLLEAATLCLGTLTAAAMLWQPLLVVMALAPLAVLGRAALVRELRDAVEHDAKTGVLTEAAWRARGEQLLAAPARRTRRARWHARLVMRRRAVTRPEVDRTLRGWTHPRDTQVVGVLMVDLDHFKAVNDSFGHTVGDVVLGEVARALRGAVRDTDLLARFGGEEFLILLVDSDTDSAHDPGHGPDGVERHRSSDGELVGAGRPGNRAARVAMVAERVRVAAAAVRVQIPTPDGPLSVGQVTVSVGAVTVETTTGSRADAHHAGELAALVDGADTALYAAKGAGRNCVRTGRARPGRGCGTRTT